MLEVGFFDDAERDFRRCLEIDPAYEICRRFVAFTLLFKGQGEEAARLFEIGMLRGQRSWRNVFLGYYAAIGNDSALSHLIIALQARQAVVQRAIFQDDY